MYCAYCGRKGTEEEVEQMKSKPHDVFKCPNCDMPLSWDTSGEVTESENDANEETMYNVD